MIGFERGWWDCRKHKKQFLNFGKQDIRFLAVSSQVTQTADQMNQMRLTIAALNAFKDPNQLMSIVEEENNAMKDKETDEIDKVAEAQVSQNTTSQTSSSNNKSKKNIRNNHENRRASINKVGTHFNSIYCRNIEFIPSVWI